MSEIFFVGWDKASLVRNVNYRQPRQAWTESEYNAANVPSQGTANANSPNSPQGNNAKVTAFHQAVDTRQGGGRYQHGSAPYQLRRKGKTGAYKPNNAGPATVPVPRVAEVFTQLVADFTIFTTEFNNNFSAFATEFTQPSKWLRANVGEEINLPFKHDPRGISVGQIALSPKFKIGWSSLP
ncbi:hypothetical protein niasHT_020750 [Heterodera trifolii]|uniref:Capsid protein n=1 Tax=Heterodera trifolii TaxID=157864 RepID=A0ABD2KJB1_9BILA